MTKKDKYSDVFEKYADWLESQNFVQKILIFFQKNIIFIIVGGMLSIAVIYFLAALFEKAEQKMPLTKFSKKLAILEQKVTKLEKEIIKLKSQSTNQIVLNQLLANGKEAFLYHGKVIWSNKRKLLLNKLMFSHKFEDILAAKILLCNYKINQYVFTVEMNENWLRLDLPSPDESLNVLLKEIQFKDSQGKSYKGMGRLHVELDEIAPTIQSKVEGKSVKFTVYDKKSGWQKLSLKIVPGEKKYEITPSAPGPFAIVQRGLYWEINAKLENNWKELHLECMDYAGNIQKSVVKK